MNIKRTRTLKEINEILNNANLQSLSIVDKRDNKKYKYGENPYSDMNIENYILCPEGCEDNWFNFCKNDYELIK